MAVTGRAPSCDRSQQRDTHTHTWARTHTRRENVNNSDFLRSIVFRFFFFLFGFGQRRSPREAEGRLKGHLHVRRGQRTYVLWAGPEREAAERPVLTTPSLPLFSFIFLCSRFTASFELERCLRSLPLPLPLFRGSRSSSPSPS